MAITTTQPGYQQGFARNAGQSLNANLWRGLVGAWSPNLGVTGAVLRDSSGRGRRDGVLTGMSPAAAWAVSGGHRALAFAAGSERVIIPQSVIAQAEFSLSFWALADVGNTGYLVSDNGDIYNLFVRRASDTNISGRIGNVTFNVADSGNAGVWNHYVFTETVAGIYKVYVNGDEVVSSAVTPFTGLNNDLWLGNRADLNRDLVGMMDDVLIHNRYLNESDVRQLYAIGRGGIYKTKRRYSRRRTSAPFAGGLLGTTCVSVDVGVSIS